MAMQKFPPTEAEIAAFQKGEDVISLERAGKAAHGSSRHKRKGAPGAAHFTSAQIQVSAGTKQCMQIYRILSGELMGLIDKGFAICLHLRIERPMQTTDSMQLSMGDENCVSLTIASFLRLLTTLTVLVCLPM